MKKPNFEALLMCADTDHGGRSFATLMHPNPRFYKYRWWIFWRESPCDGQNFLADRYALCTADAMALMERLADGGETYWIYNSRTPRFESGVTPFDRASDKWRDRLFAPALDDDTDPEYVDFR